MLLVYICAVTLGAGLLFIVQPLLGKTMLPLLGGGPAVWNTCMVFFQVTLLGGYLYAHLLTRVGSRLRQLIIHAGVLLAATVMLPLGLPEGWSPPAADAPTGWLLLALAASVGGPFFVLSSSAPLLQSWFAGTSHRSSSDPYFLYAAGNAGSLLALLGYPLVVEPLLTLSSQRHWWSLGYLIFGALALLCGVLSWMGAAGDRRTNVSGTAPLDWPTRLRWLLFAFVPSSLMLGVTQQLSVDLSPVPLLWVIPLAIYLLTFTVAFSKRGPSAMRIAAYALPVLVLLAAMQLMMPLRERGPVVLQFGTHLLALLAVALVCHGRLAAQRPRTERLTEFYLLLAAGGALGGVFNALLAPALFDWIAEYPLAIVLALLLRPPRRFAAGNYPFWLSRSLDLLLPGLLIPLFMMTRGQIWSYVLPTAVCLFFATRRLRFALGVAALLLIPRLGLVPDLDLLYMKRTFFGVHRVLRQQTESGEWRYLWHGSTRHGAQFDSEPLASLPTTYYAPSSPIGAVLRGFAEQGGPKRMAFVGLGAGTLAAYGHPDWRFTFYELDPEVVRIASDPRLFTYIAHCRSPFEFVLGDARLTLASAPDAGYDLIVLDAFSSDAIPVHLITREAVELYLSKLASGGLVAFHISNLQLDLSPVLGSVATELGLHAVEWEDTRRTPRQRLEQKNASKWVVLARTAEAMRTITRDPRWVTPPRGGPVWTDDYSNVLGALSR